MSSGGAVDRSAGTGRVSRNPSAELPDVPKPGPTASPSQNDAAQQVIDQLPGRSNVRLTLEVDPESHDVYAKVVDTSTDEVVRTIPPEEWRALASRFHEVLGLLFNQTA